MFSNVGFVFVLCPSKIGSDDVFTRIFEGFKLVQRGRSSDWMVAMDSGTYCLLESCNRQPPSSAESCGIWNEIHHLCRVIIADKILKHHQIFGTSTLTRF